MLEDEAMVVQLWLLQRPHLPFLAVKTPMCCPAMPKTKELQSVTSMAIWSVVIQEQVLLGVVLWLVEGREL